MIAERKNFADRETLAAALARDVAAHLPGVLAVSGGSTPRLFFQALSKHPLDWSAVTVTLVDERQVPISSERSNAGLVREHLLVGEAAAAQFRPIWMGLRARRFACAVLGMGTDGHTASFFPGGDQLALALNPAVPPTVIAMRAPEAGEPRLTWTLSALLAAEFLALHIEGEEKSSVLDAALGEGPIESMPIRAVLRASKPVTVYWSP